MVMDDPTDLGNDKKLIYEYLSLFPKTRNAQKKTPRTVEKVSNIFTQFFIPNPQSPIQ